jgi:DNA (cytosine-5)-methyltransferase 1
MRTACWETEAQVKSLRPYQSIELFAGGGGMALGLERAGFETVLLNEFNSDACATLRKNRPRWHVLEGDISKFDFSSFKGIDFVSGGFPCQAFSYAGQRAGFDDTRGTLFFEFARVIKETQPRVFLGENVRGLLTHDNGKTLSVIRSVIADLGYTLIEPQVLKAIFYRVPQKRERLLLVGIRNDLFSHAQFSWPSPAPRVYNVRDALMKGHLFDCDVPESAGQKYPKRKAEILSHVPPGGYWRDLSEPLQREYMKGSYFLEGGKTGLARRLSWDAPSLTLTCAPAQNQTERCHPSENRPLTVREYARIQTFPDDWIFEGCMASQYKQIGNAVPVNLAEAFGRRIVALLNSIESVLPRTDNIDFLKLSNLPSCFIYRPETYTQTELMVCEKDLVVIEDSPLTLHGTYRAVCRPWILSKGLYNYPIKTDKEVESLLLNAKYLLLTRKSDKPIYFSIRGVCETTLASLKKRGYPFKKGTPLSKRYLLYQIERVNFQRN